MKCAGQDHFVRINGQPDKRCGNERSDPSRDQRGDLVQEGDLLGDAMKLIKVDTDFVRLHA
jgi:hypothetical protein